MPCNICLMCRDVLSVVDRRCPWGEECGGTDEESMELVKPKMERENSGEPEVRQWLQTADSG